MAICIMKRLGEGGKTLQNLRWQNTSNTGIVFNTFQLQEEGLDPI
jgi:hypothetical protein